MIATMRGLGMTLVVALSPAVLQAAQPAGQDDNRVFLRTVATTVGADRVNTVRFTSDEPGEYGIVGQSYAPGFDAPGSNIHEFPNLKAIRYSRTIDYTAMSSREEVVATQGDYPPLGGGMQPVIGERRLVELVNRNNAWNMNGENAVPVFGDDAELRLLKLYMTPIGFMKAALAAKPDDVKVTSRFENNRDGSIFEFKVISLTVMGKYPLNAMVDQDNQIINVQTWVPNPIWGDLHYEWGFMQYKDVQGVKFPHQMHLHVGDDKLDQAHEGFDVEFNNVELNPQLPAIQVPQNVRTATAPPVRVESRQIADGVWFLGGGSHNSVAIEFANQVVVVEAPLNEERSLAVIAEVQRLIPNKKIRYVVNTHHHWDHSGGLRTYLTYTATIITSEGNRDYYEKVLFARNRRILKPDLLSTMPVRTIYPGTPNMVTVGIEKLVYSDTGFNPPGIGGPTGGLKPASGRIMEVYPVNTIHAGTMLVVYLPNEKILINADLYSPRTDGTAPPATQAMADLRNLIQQYNLDVGQHVGLHGGVGTNEVFLQAFRAQMAQ